MGRIAGTAAKMVVTAHGLGCIDGLCAVRA
jgi:hypothetical protein